MAARKCRRKFLRFFKRGFRDEKYDAWERGYKWNAHRRWEEILGEDDFKGLIRRGSHAEVAAEAVRIESRTNLLFSFEKMALRDAIRSSEGARIFAEGLHALLYGSGEPADRFNRWCQAVESLPRRQTRVLTWPLVTVFGFIAQPKIHLFLKPTVTRRAAQEYDFDLHYESKPSWEGYSNALRLAQTVRRDLADLKPRDMIDIQSFLWVQGSDEYGE